MQKQAHQRHCRHVVVARSTRQSFRCGMRPIITTSDAEGNPQASLGVRRRYALRLPRRDRPRSVYQSAPAAVSALHIKRRSSVDFPAPFGLMIASRSPATIERLIFACVARALDPSSARRHRVAPAWRRTDPPGCSHCPWTASRRSRRRQSHDKAFGHICTLSRPRIFHSEHPVRYVDTIDGRSPGSRVTIRSRLPSL